MSKGDGRGQEVNTTAAFIMPIANATDVRYESAYERRTVTDTEKDR
jgi:hypothetical protein